MTFDMEVLARVLDREWERIDELPYFREKASLIAREYERELENAHERLDDVEGSPHP